MFSLSYFTNSHLTLPIQHSSPLQILDASKCSRPDVSWTNRTFFWWRTNTLMEPKDSKKTYICDSKTKFLKLLANGRLSSSNINSLVYNKKQFYQVLKDDTNELEKSWRSRIFIASTPIGNIVMFYDIFKQGFAYYSDQPIVSYDILNSVAMKYVRRFSCFDFFMDEYILMGHVGHDLPLKSVFLEDDEEEKKKKEKEKENKLGNDLTADLKTAPFAKFKKYNKAPEPVKSPVYFRTNYPWFWKTWFRLQYYFIFPIYKMCRWTWHSLIYQLSSRFTNYLPFFLRSPVPGKNDKILEELGDDKGGGGGGGGGKREVSKMRNKFIYLGRFRNFDILQKPAKKCVIVGGPTKYDSMFGGGGGKAISYKDFKCNNKPDVVMRPDKETKSETTDWQLLHLVQDDGTDLTA